jgi:hypothetical protein
VSDSHCKLILFFSWILYQMGMSRAVTFTTDSCSPGLASKPDVTKKIAYKMTSHSREYFISVSWIKLHKETPYDLQFFFFLSSGATAPSGPGPPHYRGFTITLRHTTLGRTPLDEWSAHAETSTWQHTTLTTDIHACAGIRTRHPSKRAAADRRLRPRGYWDRQL